MGSSEGSAEYSRGHLYLHHKTGRPLILRYIGPLPPRSGNTVQSDDAGGSAANPTTWLGVEYFDPAHGKRHSGEYEGESIFSCSQEGAGAFIKYTPGVLVKGPSLVQAIEERYGPLSPDNSAMSDGAEPDRPTQKEINREVERLNLGNSGIVVDAPGMEAVRTKFGQLERLKEIGFEGQWISSIGASSEIKDIMRKRLKGVHTLNLSHNLFGGWGAIAEIVHCFTGLRTLILSHSRLTIFPLEMNQNLSAKIKTIFKNITCLHMADAGKSWHHVSTIGEMFIGLKELHLDDDQSLSDPNFSLESFANLETLSLSNCSIRDLEFLCKVLKPLQTLHSLNLSSNFISTVPQCQAPDAAIPQLKYLIISPTPLKSWSDIDHLVQWFPSLTSLRISLESNELTDSANEDDSVLTKLDEVMAKEPGKMTGNDRKDRPFIIAKMPSLSVLNSTVISNTERRDAEMDYVKFVSRAVSNGQTKAEDWSGYEELKAKYDLGDHPTQASSGQAQGSSLRSKMMILHVIYGQEQFELSVLPSSPVSLVKRKVAKKTNLNAKDVELWTVKARQRGSQTIYDRISEIEEGANLPIEWWFHSGDHILCRAKE